MTDQEFIKQFANDVYLTKFNRFIDNINDPDDEDAVNEIAKVARWASMFVEELELETDYEGRTINWNFIRDNDVDLGVITSPSQSVVLPDAYRKLVVDPRRPITLVHDTSVIRRFNVVEPNQITKRVDGDTEERVTLVGRKILFSKPFTAYEISGQLIGDAMRPIPRLTVTDATMLRIVPYYSLLVLGVAKNATLPGIVEGGLSPSLAQKYNALLDQAKAENENTSVPDDMLGEDFSHISGVW